MKIIPKINSSHKNSTQILDSLCAKNVSAWYDEVPVLSNVCAQINAGEFTCLCGPNGSGKSTLLSILAGTTDSNLKINADFLSVNGMNKKTIAQNIAFMHQSEYSTWNFSVEDLVLQGRFCHTKNGFYTDTDKTLAFQALQTLKIENLAKRNVHTLSGGEFQKVKIARALCQNPRFILLDEPAANLDFVYEPWLMKFLSELAHSQKIGILISVHNVNMISNYADSLILLPLLKPSLNGTIKEILTEENLEKTYGMKFECQKINYFQSLQ